MMWYPFWGCGWAPPRLFQGGGHHRPALQVHLLWFLQICRQWIQLVAHTQSCENMPMSSVQRTVSLVSAQRRRRLQPLQGPRHFVHLPEISGQLGALPKNKMPYSLASATELQLLVRLGPPTRKVSGRLAWGWGCAGVDSVLGYSDCSPPASMR